MIIGDIKQAMKDVSLRVDAFEFRIDQEHVVAKYVTNHPDKSLLLPLTAINALDEHKSVSVLITNNTFELWF